MLRTSIRLFSSSAVASQRASAEFVVPKSIPMMYLGANDNLLASNPHLPARCSAVMEFPPQPAQSPCGQNLAARAANSPPSHASPCVVTHREPEALRLRCQAI